MDPKQNGSPLPPGGQSSAIPKGRLQRITDWEAIAVQACYSSTALAQYCGVSVRHLQRHIRSTQGQNLGNWLNKLRIQHSYAKLSTGCTVKETAYSLGFKQVSHFSRLFKKHYGFSPSTVPITMEFPPAGNPGFPNSIGTH